MHGAFLLLIGLLGAGTGGANEYARRLDAKGLDEASFEAETYGVNKALKREPDGLRITLAAGAEETGWKTPPQLKIGGDFTITANLTIRKLPKPALEDGAAVGLAIAQGDIQRPELTLVRLKEPSGADVFRAIDKEGNSPGQQSTAPGAPVGMRPQPQPGQPNAKPAKPTRRTFPAAGDDVRLELRREKDVVRFQVLDAKLDRPRYLGQIMLGTNDIAAIKLFVSNRNGAEPLDVLWRDITIQADRLNGLGTTVRTVRDAIIYAEPTSIENGVLVIGGPPKEPPSAAGKGDAPKPKGQDENPSTKPEATGDESIKAGRFINGPFTVTFAPAPNPAPNPVPEPGPMAHPQPAPEQDHESKPKPKPKPKEPKARVPLDQVESIRFERTPALAARFIGQKNVDLTRSAPAAKKDEPDVKKDEPDAKGEAKKEPAADDALAPPPGTTINKVPRVNPEKNGIRDVGLALSGLRAAKAKQVTVNTQGDQGATAWRLDTTDSHDWPLVLRRSGTEPWAELYLEPPPGDSFEKEYKISVAYEDGQNGNANVKATEHTDPHRAVDSGEPSAPRPGVTVHLTGDERLYGTLEGIGPDSLRLAPPWADQAPLDVPLARVVGVHLSLPDRKESPESFAKRLKTRAAEDVLLARAKDGEVLAISGLVEGIEADRLQFRYQDRTRTLPLSQVEGWVMAARPDPRPVDALTARAALFGGLAISGVWKDLDTRTWTLEAPWGQELKLPAAEIQDVRFRGGAMTYLSDLEPSRVEETPFFGRRMPWRRDVGLLGEPLRMEGRTYAHGVAVHSRSVLTYDLNGRYARFEAVLGFDETARGRGRVDCRVLADGKELFDKIDLRADQPPIRLSLPVGGAAQIRLEVDFGRDQDAGDRVIWADARLYRPETQAAEIPRTHTNTDMSKY